jgi:hypothetical protein
MPIARQIAAISLIIVFGLVGCDGFKGLAVELDGKADATQLFWARLQGIQWHGNKDISSLSEANVATAREFDVDGVASGFSTLSEKHSQLATQLMALDANNVDEIAIGYRDRLVAAHKALSEENKTHASATADRDMQSLLQGRARLKSLLTEYAQLCGEKDSVMSKLKTSYDREFDVAE